MLRIRKDKINIFKTRTSFSADMVVHMLNMCGINNIHIINNQYNLLTQYLYTMDIGTSIIFISDYKLKEDNYNIITINYARFNNKLGFFINKRKHTLLDIEKYAIKYRILNQLKKLMK